MPPLPGPREILCCTRNPVMTRSWPLSILVGSETSRILFGVRSTCRRPGSSFRNSAAISNWICAMRNGFRSSRGAIRGTIGCTAGFTTVAIGVGPFLFSVVFKAFELKSCRTSTAYLQAPTTKNSEFQKISARESTIRGTPQNATFIFRPAFLRAEVLRLAIGAHWQCQFFRQVHSANRVLDQPLATRCRIIRRGCPRSTRGRLPVSKETADQPDYPRHDQNPKYQSYKTTQETHKHCSACLPPLPRTQNAQTDYISNETRRAECMQAQKHP